MYLSHTLTGNNEFVYMFEVKYLNGSAFVFGVSILVGAYSLSVSSLYLSTDTRLL